MTRRIGLENSRLVRDWSADARRSLERTRPSRTGQRASRGHDSARRHGNMLISATRLLIMALGSGPFFKTADIGRFANPPGAHNHSVRRAMPGKRGSATRGGAAAAGFPERVRPVCHRSVGERTCDDGLLWIARSPAVRARCVPDGVVDCGDSRSLAGKSGRVLSCAWAGQG